MSEMDEQTPPGTPEKTLREQADEVKARMAAEAGEDPEQDGQAPAAVDDPPMGGDVQLSLDVGRLVDKKARNIEQARVNVRAISQQVDALFKPDQRYAFLVFGVPGDVVTHYNRDPKSTSIPKAVKSTTLTQSIEPDTIIRADTEEAIYALFADLLDADPGTAARLAERVGSLTAQQLGAAA